MPSSATAGVHSYSFTTCHMLAFPRFLCLDRAWPGAETIIAAFQEVVLFLADSVIVLHMWPRTRALHWLMSLQGHNRCASAAIIIIIIRADTHGMHVARH